MGPPLLAHTHEAPAAVSIEKLSKLRIFNMAACSTSSAQSILTSKRAAVIDTKVHIPDGTSLKLRRMRWLITTHSVPGPLLWRQLLPTLGLNTNQFLAAAAGKYAGRVNVDALAIHGTLHGTGRTSRVSEGLFHTNDGDYNDEATPDCAT